MTQYFKIPQLGVTCISVDGVEHPVDPETGIVTIEMLTPNLVSDLVARGGLAVDGPTAAAKEAPTKDPFASTKRERAGHSSTSDTKGAAS